MSARSLPVPAPDTPSPRRRRTGAASTRTQAPLASGDPIATSAPAVPPADPSLDAAPIPIHWIDAQGTLVRANRADLELLGYGADAYLGRHLRELHVDAEVADSIAARVGRGEAVRDQPSRLRCADGTIKHVRIDCEILRVDGAPMGARCFTRDVSERARIEAALRDSEERFGRMVEGVQDYAIHTLGPDGEITSWNSGAERLHGWRGEEVLGRSLASLYLPADRANRLPDRLLREAAERGESHHEGWRLRKDGTRFWADSVLTALRDEQGRLRGFTRLARDVTHRMTTEVTRRRSLELEAENRRLLEAWRLQAEFMGSMSRELRAPLGAALAAAERLREATDDPLSDAQRAHADDVWSALRHVLRAFDEVFDVVRLEAGRMDLRLQRVHLGRLAQDAREVLRSHAAEKRVSVELETGPTPPEIEGDPGLLKLVFHNLLWAGIRSAWPDGMVPLCVSPEGPDAFRVEVVDEGLDRPTDEPGADLARPAEDGAGLADLRRAVTSRIVEAHGGRVGSRELAGGGRVHFVVLPRVARPAAGAPTARGDGAPPSADAEAPSILVVEDDAASRAWLNWTLASAGWSVVSVEDPDEALALSRERRFHAVAVGLLLRTATAADVVRRLRSEGLNRSLDVLLVTVPGEEQGVAGVVVDDLLQSPVRPDALFASLDRCVATGEAPPTVLVLDADDDARAATLATLGVLGYAGAGARDAEEALRAAAVAAPAAVLLAADASSGGLEFLRHLRRMPRNAELPVLLVTPAEAPPHGVRALRAAAQKHVLTCRGGDARILDELASARSPASRP